MKNQMGNYYAIFKEIVKNLKGKNPEEKVRAIKIQTGILMSEEEVRYPEEKIIQIIAVRFKEECPTCGGLGFSPNLKKKCPDCNGKAYVSAVEAEKIIYKKIIKR